MLISYPQGQGNGGVGCGYSKELKCAYMFPVTAGPYPYLTTAVPFGFT